MLLTRRLLAILLAILASFSGSKAAEFQESTQSDPSTPEIENALKRDGSHPKPSKAYTPNADGKWPMVSLSADGSTLYVTGTLYEGSYLKVARLLRSSPNVRTIFLSSSGGMVTEGRMIAALIRKHGLSTHVEYLCASSCTLPFIAGKNRTVGPNGRLGFHQSYQIDDDGMIIAEEDSNLGAIDWPDDIDFPQVLGIKGQGIFSKAFLRAGVQSDFIDKVVKTASDDMWYPDHGTLQSSGFLSEGAEAIPSPPLPPDSVERNNIESDLLTRPLWKFYHDSARESFTKLVDDIWRSVNSGMSMDYATIESRAEIMTIVEEKLGFASDILLDKFIILRAEIAQDERSNDYPSCKSTIDSSERIITMRKKSLLAREDDLAIELLTTPTKQKAIDAKKAGRQFEKLAGKLIQTGKLNYSHLNDDRYHCQSGFQMMEALAAMDQKSRVKAYRAVLFMD